MNIKLIRAFIASPGGLGPEREAAFEAAKEVNRSVAKPLGGRLELYGWEETLSGQGRPQAIINAEMELCELFIGAMWTSWGSRPSVDGPYTSGFQEEFELSRLRFAETQSPSMAMFFKVIDPVQLRDPGKELTKVLQFKESLRDSKDFLYGNFSTAQDFAAKVREFLASHTIRLLTEEPSAEAKPERTTIAAPTSESIVSARTVAIRPDVLEADFLVSTAEAMCGNEALAAEDVARLRLISATAGAVGNDRLVVGVHDANILYTARDDYTYSALEREGLLAVGLIELEEENTPIWTWLKEVSAEQPDLLENLTVFAPSNIRSGAFRALQLLRQPMDRLTFISDTMVESLWLNEETKPSVRAMALRYLREFGRTIDVPAIMTEADKGHKDTVALAQQAIAAILLRSDELRAARYLLSTSFESFDASLLARITSVLESLDSAELKAALDHRSPEIRARAIDILSRRNLIDLDTIGRAREDDAASVRLAALHAEEKFGQAVSLDEARKILTFSKRPTGFLLRSRDTSGLPLFETYRSARMRHMAVPALEALFAVPDHRDAAYRMLAARRIGNYGETLRADLQDGFAHYFKQHWPEGVPPERHSFLTSLMLSTDSDASKRRELIVEALDIVADQREPADLDLVRNVIDRHRSAPTAPVIAYLKALGGAEDIPRLAMTSMFTRRPAPDGDHHKTFDEAARLILRFAKSDFAGLLEQTMADAMKARLIDLVAATEFASLSNDQLLSLLLTGSEDIRRAAAKKIPGSLTRPRTKKLLAMYRANEEGRYYVVTHWLDLGLAYSKTVAREVALASG